MRKFMDGAVELGYGALVKELRVGDRTTHCASADDPAAGMKECLSKAGLKCAKGAVAKSTVAQGSGLETRDGDGRRYFVAYRGNRDYEIFRLPDDEKTKTGHSGSGDERRRREERKAAPETAKRDGGANAKPRGRRVTMEIDGMFVAFGPEARPRSGKNGAKSTAMTGAKNVSGRTAKRTRAAAGATNDGGSKAAPNGKKSSETPSGKNAPSRAKKDEDPDKRRERRRRRA